MKFKQATANYEGIPNFVRGKVQRAEFRTTSSSGKSTVTIVGGQRIRETLNEEDYEKHTRKRKYRKVIKEEENEKPVKVIKKEG